MKWNNPEVDELKLEETADVNYVPGYEGHKLTCAIHNGNACSCGYVDPNANS